MEKPINPRVLINNRLNNYDGKYVKTSINIRPNELNFLKATGYSVTAVFRKAINDLMNNKLHDDVEEMVAKQERMAKIIQQQAQFIENLHASEKFSAFQDKEEENELKRHKNKEKAEKEADEVLKI